MSNRPTIFVHVGLPKTGTTFLQDQLAEHAEALAAEGLRYPLSGAPDHFLPALDARGDFTFAGVDRPQARGAWAALAADAASARDRAVISHEVLATADGAHAQHAMQALAPFDTHLVVTARDPARQVVADWQESVKHGRWQRFDTYVRRSGIGAEGPGEASGSFQAQRLPQVLDHWGCRLPADHVHVVTVPPSGSDPGLLWERFAGVLGVRDPGRFRPSSSVRRNERLGVVETELMRRVNKILPTRVDRSIRTILTKEVYAQTVLPRVSSSAPPVLPVDLRPRVDAMARQWIEEIGARGYDVRGDLQDLVPRHVDGPSPTDWTDGQLADTAVVATAELLVEIGALRAQLRRRPRHAAKRVGRRVKRRLMGPH